MKDFMFLKGFEVELFTGTYDGENVGVSSAITKDLSDSTFIYFSITQSQMI